MRTELGYVFYGRKIRSISVAPSYNRPMHTMLPLHANLHFQNKAQLFLFSGFWGLFLHETYYSIINPYIRKKEYVKSHAKKLL